MNSHTQRLNAEPLRNQTLVVGSILQVEAEEWNRNNNSQTTSAQRYDLNKNDAQNLYTNK